MSRYIYIYNELAPSLSLQHQAHCIARNVIMKQQLACRWVEQDINPRQSPARDIESMMNPCII